ncbi:unnamed protein product [Ambrosiozyma monospora]|uniref:Unnamed protein product n=1 Tax=Ambrosiozyma monospora TaxID=43982 RepID=A0ACB5U669_AMBMO|nr:unnamed protein product [Ambrosiozyma monospora]
MLKSIEYLHCEPHQLELFGNGTLDKVQFLTLFFDSFVTEDDDCWKSLPPNLLFIHLVIGGLRFHQEFESRLIHLNPTKMTFLEDDGAHRIDIPPSYILYFNGTAPLNVPYLQVQINTEGPIDFVVDTPSSYSASTGYYSSYTCLFKYPQQ